MHLSDFNMTKEQLKELYDTYFYETFKRFDFVADRGEGSYIYDETGREYLDFMAGIAVNSAGHCNKNVVKAIKDRQKQ